jgi:hypothetical protein
VPEQAEILSKTLNKTIRSVDVTIEAAIRGMIANGIPAKLAEAVAESLLAVRDGRVTHVTKSVELVTGDVPMTFETWARKHASRFN